MSLSVPEANAIVVAPATFNTINRWVAGITNTVAVGTLCESLGLDAPIVAVPNVNPPLARHPSFRTNLRHLREWGVRVLFDDSAPREARRGALHLTALIAVARQDDRVALRQLLGEAWTTADRLGQERNDFWTAFGPTNVALHEVSTAVELGDPGEVVRKGEALDPARFPPACLAGILREDAS